MSETDPFRMIFICTGNRARSAMAEVFVREMTEGHPVEVSSAGLLELEAGAALPEAVSASSRLGVDLSHHLSRPLSGVPVDNLDLVIGFERQHVATAVVEAGAPPERTFLFRELIRTLEVAGGSAEDARGRVARAHEVRQRDTGYVPEDEIADPFGRRAEVFDDLAVHLYRSCARLVQLLFDVDVVAAGISLPPEPEPATPSRRSLFRRNRGR